MDKILFHPGIYFLIAAIIVFVGTPVARAIALKYNIVDIPDNRRIHKKITPYLGGLFIYVALIIAGFLSLNNLFSIEPMAPISLFIGVTLIFAAGILDDLFGLPAGVKMAVIGVSATVLYLSGFSVELTPFHYFNYPLTLFWFLGITNSANLMDNMNGLAPGCGVITALFMAYLAYLKSDPAVLALALALGGAYLGFMYYNFPKASIFLGDSGSILLGFSLATLGLMVGRHTGITTTLAPIFLLGLFIFDTFFVAFSRWARKIYFWEGGMDHTSHRFVSLGFTKIKAVMLVWGINIIFGLNAVIIWHSSSFYGVALSIIIIILGIVFWNRLDKVPVIVNNVIEDEKFEE